MFLCIQLSLNSWNWYFSRSISYFEPLRIFNSIFGAILMKMNHISIVGQSRAIIGRRGSYQGLSPDSHNLWGTMSLSQPSKFHVLYIKPEKSYCWKMSFKRTKGPSGLHFHLGLTGDKSLRVRSRWVIHWALKISKSNSWGIELRFWYPQN